ncbi:MAG: cytochrome b/b6 domain-containing protein [Candidatus Omnitrophica bacterium]|nr:cytochrome b/b6 domain-containing protein [Candidatus Omnitrophota bacterium]
MLKSFQLILTFLLLFPFFSSNIRAEEKPQITQIQNEDCLACHDTAISAEHFQKSVHGSNLCISCHSDIKELPHPEQLTSVNCGSCHTIESEIYNSSDHGMAVKFGAPAAKCLDCHGDPHAVLDSRDPQSPVFRMNIAKTCATCHENQEQMEKFNLLEKHPFKSFTETIHGKALIEKGLISSATCTDCHGSHDLHAPTNPNSKIYRKNVPTTCGKCHENVLRTYQRSVHGKAALSGKVEAPVCTDCHGEHTIKSHKDPTSSVYQTAVSIKTCAHCHEAEKIVSKYRLPPDRVKTYLESYHGLANRSGVTTVASCASCHGAHDILPSNDPSSSVNKRNLPKTCGRCHPNVTEQLAKGSIHLAPSFNRDSLIFYITIVYLVLIFMTIGGMLVHNGLDFLRKLRAHYNRKKQDKNAYPRFTKSERIQHLILTVTFITLAYTGFALKSPQSWWALPFTVWNADYDWRGIVHKTTAIFFSALAIYHLLFLLFTKRGRKEYKALLLKKKDFGDLSAMVKYNVGTLAQKPKFSRYNYIEKFEYWALVWGSGIMIITGAMLTFENFVMRYFPKWAVDVATTVHFYEAVLATLAILVWHLYFTIFDPDHYPMNWSMTTGKSSEEERPDDELAKDKED